MDMLLCDERKQQLTAALEGLEHSELPIEQWWHEVHKVVRASVERWRQWRPYVDHTHVDVLVRESTVHQLALGAVEFLEEKGSVYSSVKQLYRCITSCCAYKIRIGRINFKVTRWCV